MIDKLVCLGIRIYRRFVSPYKGFSCAYRIQYGGLSCSQIILKIVKSKGMAEGMPLIRERFHQCHLASKRLKNSHRADLDCGLSGCLDVGGSEGCVGDGCFGAGEAVGASAEAGGTSCSLPILDGLFLLFGRSWKTILVRVACLAVLILGIGYFFHGREIASIQIRLLDPATEDRDRKLAVIENSELPDYQLLLTTAGSLEKTAIRHNRSAAEWLEFQVTEPFVLSRLQKLTIVNKQLLTSKELESIENPENRRTGDLFEYRFINRWKLF